MKIFISWSGEKSREIALALRDWLRCVISTVEPFVSSQDIDAGSRWQAEVAAELESTACGIVCVTRDNQSAPWLNFEAGALAKSVGAGRVIPLAIDLKQAEISMPLGQFQAQQANKEGIRMVVAGGHPHGRCVDKRRVPVAFARRAPREDVREVVAGSSKEF